MPDIATIGAALASIKTAFDIAKLITAGDSSMERAELKMKFAELMSALADAKIDLADVQTALAEKDVKIAELEQAFEEKGDLIRHRDAFYNMDPEGKAVGIPNCLRCWESDHKKRQLVRAAGNRHGKVCTSCGHSYESHRADEIQPTPPETDT